VPNSSRRQAFTELGTTGLKRYDGVIAEEYLPELQGQQAVKVYTQMSQGDPVVGAILFAVDMLMRQVSWSVEPYTNSAQDKKRAAFLESCLDDMSHTWEDTLSEILSFLPYGWSFHEIVYKRRLGESSDATKHSRYSDGLIGWRKLAIRAQDTLYKWQFDEGGGVQAMVQFSPVDAGLRVIPIEKGLLFRTKARKGSPEGTSILRHAYRPWYFKKHIEEIEGIGIERDLAGLPVAWVPPQILSTRALPEERAVLEEIKKIIVNVRRDEQEGVVFPLVYDEHGNKQYDFTLLSTGGRRQFDTDQIITRYDQRIAVTILADFILLGSERVGSFALSLSKTDLFTTAIGTWLDSIAAVFNRHGIPRLFKLNGWPTNRLPVLTHGDVKIPSLQQIGEYIQTLSGAGMQLFPDEGLENYLRSAANLPPKEEAN
jgi:hypothetical protein